MASLVPWLSNAKKKVERGVGATVAQVNPLDNGRTYRTVMDNAPAPRAHSSVIQQATHNGLTNAVGTVTKPAAQLSIGLNQGAYNALNKLAGRPTLDAQQFTQQSYGKIPGFNSMVDYKGTKRQLAGAALGTVVNVAAPGSSKLVTQAATKVLPKAVPKVIPKVISGAAVGAPAGAAGNVAAYIGEGNQPITRQGLQESAVTGAKYGAALGGAIPVVGAAARKAAPVVKAGAAKTAQTAQKVEQRAFTPRVQLNDQYTLEALSNHLAGAKQLSGRELSDTIARSRDVAKRNGIELATGSKVDQLEKVNLMLDTVRQRSKNQASAGSVPAGALDPLRLAERTPQPMPIRPRPQAALATAPQVPPPMKPPVQTLTAPAGDMSLPPNQAVATFDPVSKQKTSRYAGKTVPESEFVSEQVRRDVKAGAPQYDVQTERARYTDSLGRLKAQGEDTFEIDVRTRLEAPSGKISSQDVADTQSLAAILDAKADPASLQKATELYERLSEHLTAAGQTVQAAAILSRRTPEGLRYWATKQLNQAGVKVTPELQTQLNALIAKTKTATDKQRAVFEVQKLVNDNIPSGAGDRIINFWRAGLLTAPTTTAGNLLGNTGEALVRKGFVNPVATGADMLMSLATGKRTQTLALPGAAGSGFKEGAKTLPDYIKTGYDPRNNGQKYEQKADLSYGNSPFGKALGGYVNGVYRLMGTADAPFSTSAQKEALSSIAKAEATNRGLKGNARSSFVQKFMANPPTQALERATKESDYATFKNKTILGNMASGLKRSAGPAKPVVDFVIPFTQVPSAIATRLVERTPVGIAKEMVTQIKAVKAGEPFDQRAMSQAIGNGTFGVVAIGAGLALAKAGDMTFGYPRDEKERKLWEAEGKQPYSVRVGNRWYSLNYLQPFGMLLAIGGDIHDSGQEGKGTTDKTFSAIATAAQAMQEQSFLKGISGVLDAINDPDGTAKKFVENSTSSLTPNFVRSAARAADEIQRKPEGIIEGIKSGVPGLRGQTAPKTDLFGQPLPAKDNFLNQYVNPFKPSLVREGDAVSQELRALKDVDMGAIPSQIKSDTFGKDTKLEKPQLKALQDQVGQQVGAGWKSLVATPEYKALGDEEQKKALANLSKDILAVEKAKYAAENQVGQYAPGYEGEEKKLSFGQKQLAQGKFNPKSYTQTEEQKETEFYSSPEAEYIAAKDKYDQDKSEGKITEVKDITRKRKLQKLEVGSKYDKNVRDLYEMNKSEISKYLESKGNDTDLVGRLLDYDDALTKAGLQEKSKLRDKYGNVSIKPKAKGEGQAKARSAKAIGLALKTPTIGRARQSTIKASRPSIPKFTASVRTPKLRRAKLVQTSRKVS